MIFQMGAAVVDHVIVKGGLWALESTVNLTWWSINKVYRYYYPIEDINDTELDYIIIEIENQKKEINELKEQIKVLTHKQD